MMSDFFGKRKRHRLLPRRAYNFPFLWQSLSKSHRGIQSPFCYGIYLLATTSQIYFKLRAHRKRDRTHSLLLHVLTPSRYLLWNPLGCEIRSKYENRYKRPKIGCLKSDYIAVAPALNQYPLQGNRLFYTFVWTAVPYLLL